MTGPEPHAQLALGTVQFGLPYGIANRGGQVARDEAAAILAAVSSRGPGTVVDTAPGYGDSENVLGGLLPCPAPVRIVTKSNLKNPDIRQSLSDSLKRLGQISAYGLLDHNAALLFGTAGADVFRRMQDLKGEGLVEKIGASVYTGEDIDRLLALGPIDIVQIPLNVLDQRLPRSGHLNKLKESGVEIHVRSAFLQGLLLMPPGSIPDFFAPHRPLLEKFHGACAERGMAPLAGALGYLKSLPEVDQVVVGVTSRGEWRDIVEKFDSAVPELDWAAFGCDDPVLLNPARWPQKAS